MHALKMSRRAAQGSVLKRSPTASPSAGHAAPWHPLPPPDDVLELERLLREPQPHRRGRAIVATPWGLEAHLFAAEGLIAREWLREWLEFAGQRIGLGDWRPERSGSHGRFRVAALGPIGERESGPEAC